MLEFCLFDPAMLTRGHLCVPINCCHCLIDRRDLIDWEHEDVLVRAFNKGHRVRCLNDRQNRVRFRVILHGPPIKT